MPIATGLTFLAAHRFLMYYKLLNKTMYYFQNSTTAQNATGDRQDEHCDTTGHSYLNGLSLLLETHIWHGSQNNCQGSSEQNI